MKKNILVDKKTFFINLRLCNFTGKTMTDKKEAIREAQRLANKTKDKIYTLESFAKTIPQFKELVISPKEIPLEILDRPVPLCKAVTEDFIEITKKRGEQMCDFCKAKGLCDESYGNF